MGEEPEGGSVRKTDSPSLRRFDDFLKLLLAIVVGQFVRESGDITVTLKNITVAPTSWASWLAELCPFILVVVTLRHVHGSILYDAQSAKEGFVPTYEKRLRGRALGFFAGFAAGIVAPYSAEHVLAHHEPLITGTNWILPAILLGPFAVYAAWDVAVWLHTKTEETAHGFPLQRVLGNWLFIDAIALFAMLGGLWYLLHETINARRFPPEGVVLVFSVVAVSTVLLDYILNSKFYFGVRPAAAPSSFRPE